jgi:hypothetical protein
VTPAETAYWLPRPTGAVKVFADHLGGHNSSIELAIGEDWTHIGLLQFLTERDAMGNTYARDGAPYRQQYVDLGRLDPIAAFASAGGQECFAISTGMRLLIGRIAHLTALLTSTAPADTGADIRHLIDLIAVRDYGYKQARDFANYFLVCAPWEASGFTWAWGPDEVLQYRQLCGSLAFFVLEHERQHALQGHGADLQFESTGDYFGDVANVIDSRDLFRTASWLFEFSADWHAAIRVLRMMADNTLWATMTLPKPPAGRSGEAETQRYMAGFILGSALLAYILHVDQWLQEAAAMKPGDYTSVFPHPQGSELRIQVKALVQDIMEARDALALSRPHGHARMGALLLGVAAGGAPTCLGDHFPYQVVLPALAALTRLAAIDTEHGGTLGLTRNYTADLAALNVERESLMSALLDDPAGVFLQSRAKQQQFHRRSA